MPENLKSLTGIRVLAAINGTELFGHERGNIEVFKVLRDQGVTMVVGVNAQACNQVETELHGLGFVTFPLPFGPQWSIQWVKKKPSIAITNVLAVIRCSWAFLRAIKIYRPSHVHLGSSLVYSYVSLALGLSKIPLVYRMGDCPPVDSPFNLRIWRMAMNRSTHVVANSKFVFDSASAAGVPVRKLTVIHNLAPSIAGSGISDKRFDRDSVERIIYVGAVAEHKGLLPLVEAFARIAPEYPSMRLDIVGGSRYDIVFRGQLSQVVKNCNLESRVFFHGHVSDPSLFFRQAVIHVAPSVWEEPFANVVLEAKRERIPSVVFPSGGLKEMVRHQIDGYICSEKSVDALVDGLRWMLADKDRLLQMGKAAQEDSEARFGKAGFARAWAEIYRSTQVNSVMDKN